MKSLWLLTIKNLKLLLRSKGSALIILFAPLLIILVLGLSFNSTGQYGINVGVHATSFTDDVNTFISTLEQAEFSVTKYEDSIDTCVNDIKSGTTHACVLLPESLQVEGNAQKEVVFYIDPSRVNLVWVIQESVQSQFDLKAQQLSQEITQDIITKLSNTQSRIAEKTGELNSIKEKATSASSTADSALSGLSGLDTTVPPSNYTISNLADIGTTIETSNQRLDDAINALNSAAGISDTDRDNIRSLVSGARTRMQGVLDDINGNGTSSGLSASLTTLQADLDAMKTKLTAASAAIGNTNQNLNSVKTSLQETTQSVDSVLATLNQVNEELASQQVTEAGVITSPLVTKIEKVSDDGTFLNYLFPAILVLVVMFSSLLLGTTLVLMEKNSPAFLRNFFLPVKRIAFIFSIYITNLILILIELIVILGISLLFLQGTLGQLPLVILILFLAASVFTFLGMGIGYIFNSEETGVLASISLGSILLFISGVIIPLEGLSPVTRGIVDLNPFVLAENMIREVFIFSAPIADIATELLILGGYAIVLFVIMTIAEVVLHQHLISRYMRHHHMKHRQKEKTDKSKK